MLDEMKLKEFIQCLENEKNLFQQLLEILKDEKKALLQSDFSGFDEIISKKKILVDQLSLYESIRNHLIINNNWPIEIKEIPNYLEMHYQNSSTKILGLWSEFLASARTAKELNHTNGLVITTYLRLNKHALSALHCAAGNIYLYSPKGQAQL